MTTGAKVFSAVVTTALALVVGMVIFGTAQLVGAGVVLLCLAGFIFVYPALFPYTEADRIHEAQQKALRRHQKQLDRDRKRAQAFWKERGQVIKPLDKDRFCAGLDENERVS